MSQLKDIATLKKEIEELKKLNNELLLRNKELIEQNRQLNAQIEKLKTRLDNELHNKKTLRFKIATVLYASLHGFTNIATIHDKEQLIDELDKFYLIMNDILAKYNIQKVPSIGDTIIVVGGIPKKNRTNPIEMVLAAIDIRRAFIEFQNNLFGENHLWELNIGIHTGAINVNITGKKKEIYDIKGETVNIASRIESVAVKGKIIISESTLEYVAPYFRYRFFSKLPVKYVGDLALYEILGFSPEYSSDSKGIAPNSKFNTRLQLIRYDDLEAFMLDKLERELPKYLYYHNIKHTIDVIIQSELIGKSEGVTSEELLLLKTAALFHDAGQIIQSKGHEEISVQIAREILPSFNYTEEQINKICEIILATKLPPKPKSLLEKIICDADLDYLGRQDFIEVSNTLYKELKEQNIVTSLKQWYELQIAFLSEHQYFTETANKLREVNKQTQIERLKKELEKIGNESSYL
ncbi:MAG: HD domain-containing protein [Bacteroidales bacterium]|nr:HD domain-containing protein [Bacteroidales bacterium]